jgi:hypothetical protein
MESKMKQKNLEKNRKWKINSLRVAMLLTFSFSLSTLVAQESINATGGNAEGSGGSASYSVGQLMYQTHTGTNGSVAEGVQQPFEISVVTGIEQANGINLTVMAYPNPTTDYLMLDVMDFELSALSFQLFDLNGRLLQSKKIIDSQTRIVMSSLAPAIYFVRVIQGNKEVKTFKIIKN